MVFPHCQNNNAAPYMIIPHTVSWNSHPAVTSVHHREIVSRSSCQKVCWYTIPMRKHLVTSLLILFLCQTPSRAKRGNETLSEPGRLNRMWELTGMAASAKLWGFLPLPSHRTQDQSPWLTELISTWRFLSAGKLMYRLIIQATLFGENTHPSQVRFAGIVVVISDILNLLLLSACDESVNKEMPDSNYYLQGGRLDGLDK